MRRKKQLCYNDDNSILTHFFVLARWPTELNFIYIKIINILNKSRFLHSLHRSVSFLYLSEQINAEYLSAFFSCSHQVCYLSILYKSCKYLFLHNYNISKQNNMCIYIIIRLSLSHSLWVRIIDRRCVIWRVVVLLFRLYVYCFGLFLL